jgi:23S rRNA (guanosine2251-2'-O)-methyltransferase
MAGNSSRKGAIRASKKGPTGGTGGKNKKRLTGKAQHQRLKIVPITQLQSAKKPLQKRVQVKQQLGVLGE